MGRVATASQLRPVRNDLCWSLHELSKKGGVSVRTLIRYEDVDGVPASRGRNLETGVSALPVSRIEFICTPDDAPGIRIHRTRPDHVE